MCILHYLLMNERKLVIKMPTLKWLHKYCIYKRQEKQQPAKIKSHRFYFCCWLSCSLCLIFCTNCLRLRANCLVMIHTKCYTINWAALISINQIVMRTKRHFTVFFAHHTHTRKLTNWLRDNRCLLLTLAHAPNRCCIGKQGKRNRLMMAHLVQPVTMCSAEYNYWF